MSLYAASCENLETSGTGTQDTNSSYYSNTYGIRAAAWVASSTSTEWIGTAAGLGSFTTFWHRFFIKTIDTLVSGRVLMEYSNSSGTPVFRLVFTADYVLQPQYWNGSSWTNIGSTWTISLSTLYKCDLKIVCGSSGSFQFYQTSTVSSEPSSPTLSGSASMSSVTNIDRIKSYSTAGNALYSMRTSEWIWGDETTIGARYAWSPATGNGTDTAGSGSYTDIDEAVTNDSDVSTLAANNDAETYTHGTMTLPTGDIKAVQIEARLRNGGSGAQNVKGRLRIGGTAYNQASNYSGIGVAYTTYTARWTTNPAGGSWTSTTAGQTSNEFGMLAQT